jgi:hydantoinase/carbamoylase family amidase
MGMAKAYKNQGHSRAHKAFDGIRVNPARLRAEMTELAEIGRIEGSPGLHRPGFSDADMESRRFIGARMKAQGLHVSMDAVGNLSGLWDVGAGPVVMVGSHLDTVPMGGMFDGALGVCAALEAVRALKEARAAPRHPIEVIATAEEEGRFGGMLGAQALSGQVDETWLQGAQDKLGVKLVDAMRLQGLQPENFRTAARDPAQTKAFLEIHIEQGPVLEAAGVPIGIVEGISGVFNWTVRLTGEANHAGTTPMNLRKDAFVGLVEFAKTIPTIVAEVGTDQSRITIGALEIRPNFPHTVPGNAQFSLIGRDSSEEVMSALAEACRARLRDVTNACGLALETVEHSWLNPKACHPEIVETFRRHAARLGLAAMLMPSGAGHDTQFMADLTKAGLIFVPSIRGISHSPEESTDWADIEAGANLLLHSIMDLSGCSE